MEEAPENGKESLNSAHTNGMNGLVPFCSEYLEFLASYSCTHVVTLSLPYLMYLLRPIIAALFMLQFN
jgi:hypothetical protein